MSTPKESKPFYPHLLIPPRLLKTAVFHIEPLTPQHVKLDYEAVMSSRTMLNLWGGHSWPASNFTIEENLADLKRHDQEQLDRIAFTYTVLSADKTACLGCLYLVPIVSYLEDNLSLKTAVSPYTYPALLRFWVREDELENQLDMQLLNELQDWFKSDAWAFDQIFLHTATNNSQQTSSFQAAGLKASHTIAIHDRGHEHQIFPLL